MGALVSFTWLRNLRTNMRRMQHLGYSPQPAYWPTDFISTCFYLSKLCFTISGNGTVCSPKDSMCYDKKERDFERFDIVNTKCGGCPTPCEQIIYQPILSAASFSEIALEDFAVEYMGTEYFRNNFCKLQIFFSKMTYTQMTTRAAYPVLSLFCDIGGAMGLILGSTFLTVVEILEFFARNMIFWKRYWGKVH